VDFCVVCALWVVSLVLGRFGGVLCVFGGFPAFSRCLGLV